MYKGYSHNEKECKSSDVEVSLSPALLEEAVQLSIKSDTMSVHWVICILNHSTNRVCNIRQTLIVHDKHKNII